MSRSVLLQLARDSIQEVLEAQRTIKKQELLSKHPLLAEIMATTVKLYVDGELRGEASTTSPAFSLLDDIVKNAKVSAFEDKNFTPLSTSEYLSCEIELKLKTADGVISEKDPAIIKDESSK